MQQADQIEAACVSELFENLDPTLARRLGVKVFHDGECTQVICAGIDHLLFNRTLGAPNDSEALSRVVERYRQAQVRRYFVAPQTGQADTSEFEKVGLVRYHRSWVKFVRDTAPPEPVVSEFEVRPIAEAERGECAEILARGFEFPSEAASILGTGMRGRKWHVLGAFDHGRLAAAGVLYHDGALGYFGSAATRPEYRGRRAQPSLIAARIELSRSLGCKTLVTETGEAVADQPNPSYNNLVRAGFRPHSLRPNFTLKGVRW